jgi:dTDP-4-dehydrorhamnose 3,5-epimerase
MAMQIRSLELPDILLIQPRVISDERGYFVEIFNKRAMPEAITRADFVQDNQSLSSRPFTIRGLHFQVGSSAQAKLVRVLSGSILDVVVDLRRKSPHFGKHTKAILTAVGFEQLWVPIGFAHGFCTLEPDTIVLYKVTNFFDAEAERGIRWDDPDVGIEWGAKQSEVIMSNRDRGHPLLRALPTYF